MKPISFRDTKMLILMTLIFLYFLSELNVHQYIDVLYKYMDML